MSKKVLMFAVTLQTAVYVTSLRIPSNDFYAKESENVLRRHNIYRQCHNAPALQLDEHLSKKAQQCAASYAFNRSQPEDNGTNVFSHHVFTWMDSDKRGVMEFVGASAVDQWYREQLKYPESVPTNFSQLVWKSSTKLGVGIAQADDGEVFICCTYDPVGNVDGLYEDNVLYSPRLSDSDIEKCLQSVGPNPADTAAIYKNIVRPPMFLLLVNETADGEEENSTTTTGAVTPAADAASSTDSSSTDSSSLAPKTEESNSTVHATARNCTGPNCTRGNDTRPLMSALKKELQLAVAENSKITNDLIKIAIVIAIVIMIFVVIVLIVTIVILSKIIKMMHEDECCETGNETPADEPRFAKSLGTSTSVAQSLQSYM